ncbi:MAG TPA: hypothetical protein VII75_07255 [Thermoanaerobaculia bacterium]
MKALTIAVLMLISTTAYAQQNTTVTPQRPALQVVTGDESANRVDVEVGAVRLTTHSGRYTVAYLPVLAPLQGTALRPSIEMPNAFALTGTSIPLRPHTRPRGLVDIR